jgi:SAM-dependent methyltransferase
MTKHLARLQELQQDVFVRCMEAINETARRGGLREYTTYSRIWEYPWAWLQLQALQGRNLQVLDIGSEMSPFPWFLAARGFNVVVSDVTPEWWRVWKTATRRLGLAARLRLFDARHVDLPTASVDIYLSVSVIEHVSDKAGTIKEAARVLRPGGLLVMTFDVCEPEMGMTFPEWNGRALSMREFDHLFTGSRWFEPGIEHLRWNEEDIPGYLSWNRTTAPHHNYVTGGAVVRRNTRAWEEAASERRWRIIIGKICTARSVAVWGVRSATTAARRLVGRRIRSALRRALTSKS